MALLPWPLHPCNMHKNPLLLISLSYLSLTSVSSRTESNLKKNPRPVSVCLNSIKGKPNPRQSKWRISCLKNNSHFQKRTTADTQTCKTYWVFSVLILFFSPCCECESWGSLIISLNSAPKKPILFTQLRNSDAKHPHLFFFRRTKTYPHPQTLPNDCFLQTRKTAIKW